MKNKNIIMVSLIFGIMLLSPMISATLNSEHIELSKGWNIVEFKEDIDWIGLRFSDGTEELSISEAGDAGWISSTLQYWGYWNLFGVYTFRFIDVDGDWGKTFISGKEQVLVYSNQDRISIVVDKPNKVKVTPYNSDKPNRRLFKED